MFINKSELKRLIHEAVHLGKDYPTQITQLKKDLAELKTQKVMEEREIKHLIKLKEEKLEVENQKKVLELDKKYGDMTMKLQKEYHDKQLVDLDLARKEMKEVYTKIMERLPNITAALELKGKR